MRFLVVKSDALLNEGEKDKLQPLKSVKED
jgi:hypothetical protein